MVKDFYNVKSLNKQNKLDNILVRSMCFRLYKLNVVLVHQNQLLAFKVKCMAFLQSCKRSKRFTFGFTTEDFKNQFHKREADEDSSA